MRIWFLKFILWWLHYDLALTKQRLQECKDVLEFDKRRIEQYELELMHLESGGVK